MQQQEKSTINLVLSFNILIKLHINETNFTKSHPYTLDNIFLRSKLKNPYKSNQQIDFPQTKTQILKSILTNPQITPTHDYLQNEI
jgi:hypothetical protein